MGLKETIQSDMKTALKNKQSARLEALRFLFSAVKNAEIQKKPENLTEEDLTALLKKQVKIYEEAITQYVEAKQSNKAEEELIKLEFLKEYLPPPIKGEELSKLVSEAILDIKAKGLSDQGLVIKEVRKRTKGAVDNVEMVRIVRENLKNL